MRGERASCAAASLAAVATLVAFGLPAFGAAELDNGVTDPSRPGLYGDQCSVHAECHFQDAVCDEVKKICRCHQDTPVSNHVDKCGKPVSINETCMFNEQCEEVDFKTECRNDRCTCKFDMVPEVTVDGSVVCKDPSRLGRYGDQCSVNAECGFQNAVCDEMIKTCTCHPNTPVTNHVDKCGKPASINETCIFNEQCEDVDFKTECHNGHCKCKFDMVPEVTVDGTVVCKVQPTLIMARQIDPSRSGRYGDPCSVTAECRFQDAVCDEVQKLCMCHPDTPVSNHVDKCGKPASINETCMFNEQCEDVDFKTECRNDRCTCKYEMVPEVTVDGSVVCKAEIRMEESLKTLDPAMIGILVAMALMFVIICVVLRLFSRARWRENRTIFNTPNPRLMNVSLLRDSKLLHSQDRRGSRVSMRPPSRQASQQELHKPHSPIPGSRRGSRASSGHSATSLRSATLRSPTTPGPTSVTVEIRAPDN